MSAFPASQAPDFLAEFLQFLTTQGQASNMPGEEVFHAGISGEQSIAMSLPDRYAPPFILIAFFLYAYDRYKRLAHVILCPEATGIRNFYSQIVFSAVI